MIPSSEPSHPICRRLRSVLVGLLIVIPLSACGPTEGEIASHPASGQGGAGRPGAPPPERIISLAPNLTEIVYHLEAEDRLVGVSRYCKFPPQAADKPTVGALTDVDFEKLIMLRPDLVLLLPSHADTRERLGRLSVPTLTVRSETIQDIYAGIAAVARALGRESEGRAVSDELRAEFAELEGRLSSDAAEKPPRVLFVAGRNPGSLQQIYGCGSGNFLNDLLTSIGVENVLGETELPWPVINKESILSMDPEIILDGSLYGSEGATDPVRHMAAWNDLGSLSAVRGGRVIRIADEHLLIPGPGFVGSAENLIRVISDARAD